MTTHTPLNVAERLAPVPTSENADTAEWVRHYAALALAAYTAFDRELGTVPPNSVGGSRPQLGYLVALGNAATAAAVALTHTGPEATSTLWWLTPEQGALNGEWEDWLTETLDEHGVNPADINPAYSSENFRSPVAAREMRVEPNQCPHCTSPSRHHRFVMPLGGGTEPCGHGWHDGSDAAPRASEVDRG